MAETGVNTLYGFAYETIPFKGILTGQTMDSPDEPGISSDSVEPGDSRPHCLGCAATFGRSATPIDGGHQCGHTGWLGSAKQPIARSEIKAPPVQTH